MQTPIPTSALLALWLNAWLRGDITDSDARNALESLTNQTLTLPTKAEYAIASPHEVTLSRALILKQNPGGQWAFVDRENSVALPDMTHMRQAFLDAISESADQLTALDISGSRTEVDEALEELEHQHLPNISVRDYTAFHNALRTRVAAHYARTHSTAIASRSQDVVRIETLTRLENACIDFMCSIASTA